MLHSRYKVINPLSLNSLPAMSPNVLYPFSYACVIKSSQSVSPFSLLPSIHSFTLRVTYKILRHKQKTRHKRSRGYWWEPRQWCQWALKVTTRAQEPSGPQDEAQNSTEVGKQIQSLERNKPNMEREDKAPETFDKCLLNGSLKMDLCQLVRPKVNYLWPATSFSHNSLCIDKAVIHVFVNRAQSGLKCAWSSPQVCAAFQDERGLTSEHQLLS